MPKGKAWSYSEEVLLSENYSTKTIKELLAMFPNRTDESINNKVRRLKNVKKITENKDPDAIKRSYVQR